MQQIGVVPSPSKSKMKRVLVTDGSEDALVGICVFFLRPNTAKPLTSANIAEVCTDSCALHCDSSYFVYIQETVCGALDVSDGRSVLEVIEEYLSKVMIPALCQAQNWGPLTPQQINNFMATLKGHVEFLRSEWL